MFVWIFSWVSVIDRKYSAFNKTFSPGLTELVSTCRKKNFEAKLIFKKSLCYIFFGPRSNCFRLFVENFWRGCQNCLLRFHSNILKKKCLKFSDVGQKTIGILWQTLRQGCQNCFPGVHGNKLSRNTFRWKPDIFLFRHWAENFHFSPKVFWLGCQNCIPPGNRIILRRSILFEFSPIFFGHWAKIFRDFVECLSTGLSKLFGRFVETAIHVSNGTFSGERFFWQNCMFSNLLWNMSEKFSVLCHLFSGGLSELYYKCP